MKVITTGGPFPDRESEVPDWTIDSCGRSTAAFMAGQGPRTGNEVWYVDSGMIDDLGRHIFWPKD
jgi:hypothetical protein